MLEFLLAPAIIAGILAFALARFHEARQHAVAQLRAATAMQVELVANVTTLRRFTATFRETAERMLTAQVLLESGVDDGEAAIRCVRLFLSKRRRALLLVGYDPAAHRLLHGRLRRTVLGPVRRAISGWYRRRE